MRSGVSAGSARIVGTDGEEDPTVVAAIPPAPRYEHRGVPGDDVLVVIGGLPGAARRRCFGDSWPNERPG